ncbi:MAG: CRISPR-associated helicase Cas3' [Bryobacteraceae bacterium]
MRETCYAHSREAAPQQQWHRLDKHLEDTARRAESFAACFAPGWGNLAGLWHDAGKYQDEFQRYIGVDSYCEGSPGRVDHSSVGALIAKSKGPHGWPLAMVIAGHHGGLKALTKVHGRLEGSAERLNNARQGGLPADLENLPLPPPPDWVTNEQTAAMWTRFVFSALVDADFLDTEEFYDCRTRDVFKIPLSEFRDRLETYLNQFADQPASPVNDMRRRVLEDCRRAASREPGVFRLTVPTGGGKTLSSLAFALNHAVLHGLRRVIVVIPFTSILEQTAETYRKALGSEDAVLEHHSNVDPDKPEDHRSRQACENWDAPIVVTTSVQFFESLYANKTSRCRKLHRMARSVVVFDEVQTFPPALLTPIEHALKQLAHYGTSIVLCTATQPALKLNAVEIVSDVEREFAAVAGRVNYVFPESEEKVQWGDLAEEIRAEAQVLAIVHRRDDAVELANLVGGDCIHLSARMCAAHRSEVITYIKQRLASNLDCRVVSTQLVEAGVDLDFPVVYRAMAGADALAQAAGRCNREGNGPTGELRVFHAPKRPFRELGKAMDEALVMFREGRLDLTKPQIFHEYFKRLYSASDTDPGVIAAEKAFDFPKSAELFEMIRDEGKPVVAPRGDSAKWVSLIRSKGINRDFSRHLQRFIVNLFPIEIQRLERQGHIEQLGGLELWVTTRYGPGVCYSPRFGFMTQEAPLDPAELMK